MNIWREETMKISRGSLLLTAFCALLGLGTGASAQPAKITQTCTFVGPLSSEPIGDRPGHTINSSNYSCIVQDGPFKGAVMTGASVYQIDKGAGTLQVTSGIDRRPGGIAVWLATDGRIDFQVVDGKVTGWVSTASGSYRTATGNLSELAGKRFRSTSKPTGPLSFMIETVIE
jgi:hypothetical protein